MIKLRIISVGRMKEKYWLAAQEEYLKRLKRFAQVEVVELPDLPTPDDPTDAERRQVLKKEGERVLNAMRGFDVVCSLAIEGKQYDSPELARALGAHFDMGRSICFIIGGSLGLDDEIKRRSDMLVSFSRLTLPHRLARIVLLEQLFRSFKILGGESYHK